MKKRGNIYYQIVVPNRMFTIDFILSLEYNIFYFVWNKSINRYFKIYKSLLN